MRISQCFKPTNSTLYSVYNKHMQYFSMTVLLSTKFPSPIHACLHSLHPPIQVTKKRIKITTMNCLFQCWSTYFQLI